MDIRPTLVRMADKHSPLPTSCFIMVRMFNLNLTECFCFVWIGSNGWTVLLPSTRDLNQIIWYFFPCDKAGKMWNEPYEAHHLRTSSPSEPRLLPAAACCIISSRTNAFLRIESASATELMSTEWRTMRERRRRRRRKISPAGRMDSWANLNRWDDVPRH